MESVLSDTRKMGPIPVPDDSYREPSPHPVTREMGRSGSGYGRGMKSPPHSRRRLEGDLVTQRLQTPDEVTPDGLPVALVKIVAA